MAELEALLMRLPDTVLEQFQDEACLSISRLIQADVL
jgi:hypothetical protein